MRAIHKIDPSRLDAKKAGTLFDCMSALLRGEEASLDFDVPTICEAPGRLPDIANDEDRITCPLCLIKLEDMRLSGEQGWGQLKNTHKTTIMSMGPMNMKPWTLAEALKQSQEQTEKE